MTLSCGAAVTLHCNQPTSDSLAIRDYNRPPASTSSPPGLLSVPSLTLTPTLTQSLGERVRSTGVLTCRSETRVPHSAVTEPRCALPESS